MALFKINKGLAANLPKTYTEGYCYFTTDDGKFYIDTSNVAAGRVAINSVKSDKVYQASYVPTQYTNWRPLLVGESNSGTEGFSPANAYGQAYTFNTITVQPSSGTIRANTMKALTNVKISNANVVYNATNQCLDFTFD